MAQETTKHDLELSASGVTKETNKALDLLHETAEYEHEIIGKLQWKVDLRLMPLLCVTYALQSIDKTTLGYAAVFNLREDAHLTGTEYSWLGAIFYLGYLFWEFPTNVFLQKLPINHFMSFTVVAWGIVLMLHAPITNFAGIAATRTFLGVFEASISPGTMLLFSMYYNRSEQAFRWGLWLGSAGIGYIIAGIASFGIGHIQSYLASWRLIFLIWGAITTAWGCVTFVFLPGSPLTAKFLTEEERAMVVARVKKNSTGIENKEFKWSQFFEALKDTKTWLLFIFAVASQSPNGGLTTFQSLVIKGMGFSTLQTTLVQMPSGAVQAIICPLACFAASRYHDTRLNIMLACLAPFLAGTLGLWLIDSSRPYGRLACLWISFCYTATWTLSMALATANTAGHTKKITTNAILLIGYCVGNFIGPFFFLSEQAPSYPLGVTMMLVCIVIQVIALFALRLLLWRRNKARSEAHNASGVDGSAEAQEAYARGFADETDLQNKYFRYVY